MYSVLDHEDVVTGAQICDHNAGLAGNIWGETGTSIYIYIDLHICISF